MSKKEKVQIALETEPESLRDAMNQWRTLMDHIGEVDATVANHKDKIKELKSFITSELIIPDGEIKSETISIPGIGTAYKKSVVNIRVTNWEGFQSYLSRNKMDAVVRRQCNLAPSEELYNLVMDGELPMPKSAEFSNFEKLSIRRIG